VGSAEHSLALQAHLAQANIRAFAVRPPTVQPQQARVRLALHVGHLPSPSGQAAAGYAALLQALAQGCQHNPA
jgi:7-keto-8-aminopelargonate synthetase-like enzyme